MVTIKNTGPQVRKYEKRFVRGRVGIRTFDLKGKFRHFSFYVNFITQATSMVFTCKISKLIVWRR